jgi:hypothetical protein
VTIRFIIRVSVPNQFVSLSFIVVHNPSKSSSSASTEDSKAVEDVQDQVIPDPNSEDSEQDSSEESEDDIEEDDDKSPDFEISAPTPRTVTVYPPGRTTPAMTATVVEGISAPSATVSEGITTRSRAKKEEAPSHLTPSSNVSAKGKAKAQPKAAPASRIRVEDPISSGDYSDRDSFRVSQPRSRGGRTPKNKKSKGKGKRLPSPVSNPLLSEISEMVPNLEIQRVRGLKERLEYTPFVSTLIFLFFFYFSLLIISSTCLGPYVLQQLHYTTFGDLWICGRRSIMRTMPSITSY